MVARADTGYTDWARTPPFNITTLPFDTQLANDHGFPDGILRKSPRPLSFVESSMAFVPDWLTLFASVFWLAASVTSVIAAAHAFAPSRHNILFIFSFFSTWLTQELAGHHLVAIIVGGVGLVILRGWDNIFGIAALTLNLVSVVLLTKHLIDGRRAANVMKDLLRGYASDDAWPRIPRNKMFSPFKPAREEAQRTQDIEFASIAGQKLRLDVYEPKAPRAPGELRPAIIQVHGGGWIIGDKREQGLPLLYHLASHGWVGFNVNYRLSPGATFPDHLIDIKRAIAWIREHAETYGIDPNFIAITGGSAGGHLCALMALTSNDPRYQPGFEDADTSVQAAVPIYGVYDFTDRLNLMGRPFRKRVLEPLIMKAFYDEEPEKYLDASPLELVHHDAPPMLVIHGDRDVLAPVEYARLFTKELRAVSANPVFYAEIPGAQHAFEIFASPRTVRVIAGVERFLNAAHQGFSPDMRYYSPFAPQPLEEDNSLPLV